MQRFRVLTKHATVDLCLREVNLIHNQPICNMCKKLEHFYFRCCDVFFKGKPSLIILKWIVCVCVD